MPRLVALLLMLVALAGCGAEDRAEQLADDAERELREQGERVRAEVRRLRDRIEELIGQLRQAVPRADRTSPVVQVEGPDGRQPIDVFLTGVLKSVDGYWTRT